MTYIHVIKFAFALPDQCHVKAIFYVSLFVEDKLLKCCERTSECFASCTLVAFVVSKLVWDCV